MKMISTIIFDVGGVLIRGSFDEYLKKISEILEVEVKRDSDLNETINDWMRGRLTFKESIEKMFGVSLNKDKTKQIFNIWSDNWNFDKKMIDFARKFKPKYKLIMLSNADREGVERWDNDFFDFFDRKFISYELGLIKPEREIYEYVLREINREPGECVFIDDKPENIEGARNLGIHGIIFESKEQLKEELKKLGVVE